MQNFQIETKPSTMPIMNVDEARKVMWLHNNYRSLGELFDEGYLDQTRLEWAAKNAYDSKLRQASKVLLDWSFQPNQDATHKCASSQTDQSNDQAFPIDISIEKVRATPWPFPPYKGQLMGPLVETKQLSLKDLGYAIENAWDERVRRAAMALSMVRMKQKIEEPTPSAGFVHLISGGRSYSEQEQLRLTLIEGLIFGAVFMALIALAINAFIKDPPQPGKFLPLLSTPGGILALLIFICLCIGLPWLLNYLIGRAEEKFDQQINNYQQGQEGEDRVIETILQALDGNWHLFRNVVLPGRNRGDVDAVLVGPSGVWVLEIKNLNGEYRNIGEQWEYRKGNHWVMAKTNSSRQAENNAIRLANFFKADNIKQWVTSVVVWANPENSPIIQNPATAVWPWYRLPDELGNLWNGQPAANTHQEIIVNKLTQLCKRQNDFARKRN